MLNLVKGLRKYKKMSTISTRLMIWAVHPKTLGGRILVHLKGHGMSFEGIGVA